MTMEQERMGVELINVHYLCVIYIYHQTRLMCVPVTLQAQKAVSFSACRFCDAI